MHLWIETMSRRPKFNIFFDCLALRQRESHLHFFTFALWSRNPLWLPNCRSHCAQDCTSDEWVTRCFFNSFFNCVENLQPSSSQRMSSLTILKLNYNVLITHILKTKHSAHALDCSQSNWKNRKKCTVFNLGNYRLRECSPIC